MKVSNRPFEVTYKNILKVLKELARDNEIININGGKFARMKCL